MKKTYSFMILAVSVAVLCSQGCGDRFKVYRNPDIKQDFRMLVMPMDVNDPNYFISDKFEYMERFVEVFARDLQHGQAVSLSPEAKKVLDLDKVRDMVEAAVNHHERLLEDKGLLGKGVTVKPFGETIWPASPDDVVRSNVLSLLSMAGSFDAFAFIVIDMQKGVMPEGYKSIARVLILDPGLNVLAFARTEGFGVGGGAVYSDPALASDLAKVLWQK